MAKIKKKPSEKAPDSANSLEIPSNNSGMSVIQEFLSRYRREYDFFSQAGTLVAEQLETELQATGIRGIVTHRAKRPDRLENKLASRVLKRPNGYQSVDDIYVDIVDLVGVRVALYFPGDREIVSNLIQAKFQLVDGIKSFPDFSRPPSSFESNTGENYQKRFTGYWASHYRVQLRESSLAEPEKRYSEARVEIQVASVLMHAWSEVEHDLIYKPLQGPLSVDEYAILDELNGMVLAGEVALERLQRAVENRVKIHDNQFRNHYELASYIFDKMRFVTKAALYPTPLSKSASYEPIMGRVDVLFDLLKELGIATPGGIATYIESLDPETEKRPIADQIIDEIIAADPNRYEKFSRIRSQRTGLSPYDTEKPERESSEQEKALGFFISKWIEFEKTIRELGERRSLDSRILMAITPRTLQVLEIHDPEMLSQIDITRRLRNNLLHGVETYDPNYLNEAGRIVEAMIHKLPVD